MTERNPSEESKQKIKPGRKARQVTLSNVYEIVTQLRKHVEKELATSDLMRELEALVFNLPTLTQSQAHVDKLKKDIGEIYPAEVERCQRRVVVPSDEEMAQLQSLLLQLDDKTWAKLQTSIRQARRRRQTKVTGLYVNQELLHELEAFKKRIGASTWEETLKKMLELAKKAPL